MKKCLSDSGIVLSLLIVCLFMGCAKASAMEESSQSRKSCLFMIKSSVKEGTLPKGATEKMVDLCVPQYSDNQKRCQQESGPKNQIQCMYESNVALIKNLKSKVF